MGRPRKIFGHKRLNVHVSPDVHRQLHAAAGERDMTIQDFVTWVLTLAVKPAVVSERGGQGELAEDKR
jgi:predicted HicB family RNase H-like nuclease